MAKIHIPNILYVSSFPPRECGIATFTQDLINAIDKEFNPEIKNKVLAMNVNGTSIYNYPRRVIMHINETEIEDYLNRANEINKNTDIKIVNIQHEYGLFGGDWGEYLLFFLELIKKPIIITMHTILPNPKEKVKKLTKLITDKCELIITMTKSGKNTLIKEYGINPKKIKIIPHGVHHIAFPSKTRAKKKLNLSGRTILSTFGMLNRDKGIEYAIEALPKVINEYPNILYLILGATHPLVQQHEGEKYRNKLKRLIAKHKLKDYVKFYDKYMGLNELIDFLKATDIYISPTLNPQQAVSGTISYALSCACPIIATANQYARDVINRERGILVRFKKSGDIKKALLELLSDKKARREMKKNTYFYSRHMTWQNVALSYFEEFNKYAKIRPRKLNKLPAIKLDYIKRLTDKFGIIQFANHTKPDTHSGYCLDDNARVLFGFAQYYNNKKQLKSTLNLISIYLKFIKFTQKANGKFYNFVSFQKTFNEKTESEDSFGRAIWALGHLISQEKIPNYLKKQAQNILTKTLKWIPDLKSLRAVSFALIGLTYLNNSSEKKETIILIKKLSTKLLNKYQQQTSKKDKKNWDWFEDCITYSNYKLPEALFRAYQKTKDDKYKKIAENSIKFLNNITFEKEYFSPIGQDGWYFRNGKRAYFDQQPEDAASAVEALIVAYQTTKNEKYKAKAKIAFAWFLGKNHLNQMVYDEATGGCYDGLGKYSLNFNQGAESTISYLLARMAMEKIK